MARVSVSRDLKIHLGKLILEMASGDGIEKEANMLHVLQSLGFEIPDEVQTVRVHRAKPTVLHIVVPHIDDVSLDVADQEKVIRSENDAYVEAKEDIDRTKDYYGEIPKGTVSDAYAELIGHNTLAYCSRFAP